MVFIVCTGLQILLAIWDLHEKIMCKSRHCLYRAGNVDCC